MRFEILNPRLVLVIMLSWMASPCSALGQSEPLPELVKEIAPAVVTIQSFQAKGGGTSGSGFFIDHDLIATNWHVLKGGVRFAIRGPHGQSYRVVSTVAIDKSNDVAILRVSPGLPAGSVLFLNDYLPVVGERIFVIGNALGFLSGTVSDGIVSAVRRLGPANFAIQITAPISPGSSGSPVVDMRGNVVGVATFRLVSGQSLNFAIGGGAIERALARVNVTLPSRSPFKYVTIPTANWVPATVGGVMNYEYNPDTVERRSNGAVKAWVRVSPNAEGATDQKARKSRIESIRAAGHSVAGYDRWTHILVLYELDCAEHRFKILETDDYDDTGHILNSLGSDPRGWLNTTSSAVNRRLLEMICR